MIVNDKKNVVIGSNALETANLPKRRVEEKKSNNREKEIQKIKKVHKNIGRLKLLMKAGGVFVLGLIIVGRSAHIYETQEHIASMKNEIERISFENDDIKLQLSKSSDIKEIEMRAKNEISMVEPTRASSVTCEIKKDYFSGESVEKESKGTSIWDTLKKWLF